MTAFKQVSKDSLNIRQTEIPASNLSHWLSQCCYCQVDWDAQTNRAMHENRHMTCLYSIHIRLGD